MNTLQGSQLAVVPFGKYKGQPLEVMAQDREYVEWLTAQPWFRERHSNLYTVVINNFTEPNETPEHNALQIKFLDDSYCMALAWLLGCRRAPDVAKVREYYAGFFHAHLRHLNYYLCGGRMQVYSSNDIVRKEFENKLGIDVSFYYVAQTRFEVPIPTAEQIRLLDVPTGISDEWLDRWAFKGNEEPRLDGFRIREEIYRHVESLIPIAKEAGYYFNQERQIAIEIKPSIGDDYPAVLRQMKRSGAQVLFISSYSGMGATREQFVSLFQSQGIRVVFEADLDRAFEDEFREAI